MPDKTYYELWRYVRNDGPNHKPIMYFEDQLTANIVSAVLASKAGDIFAVVPNTSGTDCPHWFDYKFEDFTGLEKYAVNSLLLALINKFKHMQMFLKDK